MYLEVLGFWGLVCLVMFFVAEWKRRNVIIGLIGGILLVFLGVWLLIEDVQIKTGETTTLSSTSVANSSISNITYTPTSGSETKTYNYISVVATYFTFNQTLGIIFMLIGIWASFKYAFDFKNGW